MNTTGIAKNWIPDVSTFGARLALLRWRMGWNVREAERECNVSQNLWSGWENGSSPRNYVEIVNRIVLRTGVDKIWLMTGDGSPEPTNVPGDDNPNMHPSDYKPVHSLSVYRKTAALHKAS